ncbi:unnamed protein product [Brassica oleracea var. botrytis]|uniref:(rape) hypothetical protein n=1 Tax=Brassica napus TaxID=3708 RepID=A0A816Q4R9_BRANA|nr:unnamed protein product [Brassica napus]
MSLFPLDIMFAAFNSELSRLMKPKFGKVNKHDKCRREAPGKDARFVGDGVGTAASARRNEVVGEAPGKDAGSSVSSSVRGDGVGTATSARRNEVVGETPGKEARFISRRCRHGGKLSVGMKSWGSSRRRALHRGEVVG